MNEQQVEVSLGGLETPEEVLAAFGEGLGFPEWYGVNLDALADCLRDLDRPALVLWPGWAAFAAAHTTWFESLLAVLRERADILTVVLAGE